MQELPIESTLTLQGDGAPVLLLHGAGSDRQSWNGLIARLENRYRCIAPDLPGTRPRPREVGLSFDDVVSYSAEMLSQYGPCHLVGYSHGGLLAARLAAEQHERVLSVITIAAMTHGDLGVQHYTRLWEEIASTNRLAWARLVFLMSTSAVERSQMSDEAADGLVQGLAAGEGDILQLAPMVRESDVRRFLPQIKCPTHVIACTQDASFFRHSLHLHATVKHSTYSEVASGHAAPWLASERLWPEVERVLDRAANRRYCSRWAGRQSSSTPWA